MAGRGPESQGSARRPAPPSAIDASITCLQYNRLRLFTSGLQTRRRRPRYNRYNYLTCIRASTCNRAIARVMWQWPALTLLGRLCNKIAKRLKWVTSARHKIKSVAYRWLSKATILQSEETYFRPLILFVWLHNCFRIFWIFELLNCCSPKYWSLSAKACDSDDIRAGSRVVALASTWSHYAIPRQNERS